MKKVVAVAVILLIFLCAWFVYPKVNLVYNRMVQVEQVLVRLNTLEGKQAQVEKALKDMGSKLDKLKFPKGEVGEQLGSPVGDQLGVINES